MRHPDTSGALSSPCSLEMLNPPSTRSTPRNTTPPPVLSPTSLMCEAPASRWPAEVTARSRSFASWSSASTPPPAFRRSGPPRISRCSASRNTRFSPIMRESGSASSPATKAWIKSRPSRIGLTWPESALAANLISHLGWTRQQKTAPWCHWSCSAFSSFLETNHLSPQ
jgi:hypothetical protein